MMQEQILQHNCLEALTDAAGSIYWKNRDGIYLDGNHYLRKKLAAKGLLMDSVIGRTDDVIFSKSSAEQVQMNDLEIINKNCHSVKLEKLVLTNKELTFLSSKKPFLNATGDICGIIGISIDITDYSNFPESLPASFLKKPQFGNKSFNKTLWLSKQWQGTSLTFRQAECAYYLCRGKTINDIAGILQISPRTVEDYLNKVKIKIGCYKKSDLIEILFSSGILADISNFIF